MRKKVAGRVVREHRHLPNPCSAQDVSVEKAQPEMCCVSFTQKHRRLQDPGQVPDTTASPAAEAKGKGTVAHCPLLEDYVSLDHQLPLRPLHRPMENGQCLCENRLCCLPVQRKAAAPLHCPGATRVSRRAAGPWYKIYPKQLQAPPAVLGDFCAGQL